MSSLPIIFVVGGTGAQGIPIVRGLVEGGKYAVRILTRNAQSARAQELAALSPNISFVEGSFTDENALREGYKGAWGAFINLDGFTVGEKGEGYWAARSYELAVETGIKFFVWGNLDYSYKLSGYKPEFRTGHFDGKGRAGNWILQENRDNKGKPWYKTKAALFTSGPYMEMTIASYTPMSPEVQKDAATGAETVVWRLPLGEGATPHVSLEDCGYYVRWLFDNADRADGMNLAVAIEHVDYADMAAAFTRVTGHPARFEDIDLDTYWRESAFAKRADAPAAVQADPNDPATMTVRQNFSGFWNTWRASGGNRGVITRDYALLDEIFPGRIKSAEEYFRRVDQEERAKGSSLWEKTISAVPILKIHEDAMAGRINRRA
jgi:hypothetical protein